MSELQGVLVVQIRVQDHMHDEGRRSVRASAAVHLRVHVVKKRHRAVSDV